MNNNWAIGEMRRLDLEFSFCEKVHLANKVQLYDDLIQNMYSKIFYIDKTPTNYINSELDVMLSADVSRVDLLGNGNNSVILLSTEYTHPKSCGTKIHLKGDLSSIKYISMDQWVCHYFITLKNSGKTIVLQCVK